MRTRVLSAARLTLLAAVVLGGCDKLIGLDGDYTAGAPCVPGTTEPCYTGPKGSETAAGCRAGIQVCNKDGFGHGECLLEMKPAAGAAACACTPGETMPCYSGPPETMGVGLCKAGTATCKPDGTGFDCPDHPPAVEQCGTADDESCDGIAACEGTYRFAHLYGNNPTVTGTAVAVDDAGNAWVTGLALGSVDFGGGALDPTDPMSKGMDHDVFLLKLDDKGRHLVSKRFGDAGDQVPRAIATDAAGNVFVLGDFTGGTLDFGDGSPLVAPMGERNVFLAAFSPEGKCLWSKRFGSPGEQDGHGVAVDRASGDVFITGAFYGTLNFGGGDLTAAAPTIYVAKLKGSDGSYAGWAKAFGVPGAYQFGFAIATDPQGDVVIAGDFTIGPLNLSGMPQDDLPCAGGHDVFVAKLKGDNGAWVWSKGYGDPLDDITTGLAVDGSGDVLLTGQFAGTVDFGDGVKRSTGGGVDSFLVKLATADGMTVWAHSFGNAGTNEYGSHVAVDAAGNVVLLGGEVLGLIDFGGGPLLNQGNVDFAIAKLDPSGNHLWSHRFAGAGDQIGRGIAVDALGRMVMTGNNLVGIPNFGGGPLVPPASRTILVAGFAP